LALQKSNLNVRREILGEPTNPSTPLAVPKISCLHHRLLGKSVEWRKSGRCRGDSG
jgi:hypothetical protein